MARKRNANEASDRLAALGRVVAARFKGFQPAAEVLTKVRAVPTIFPQFDHATKVGGLPVERFMLVHGPSAHGKAQPLSSLVLTPTGWRRIGDLCVGDSVVASSGEPATVVGVYPQGELPIYRVHFSDRTQVECCEEHLWYTTTPNERSRGKFRRAPRPSRERIATGQGDGPGSVKSLREILSGFKAFQHEVPRVSPVLFDTDETNQVLPIDPYVLGLILGDGVVRGASVVVHKPEPDLWDAIERRVLPDRVTKDTRYNLVRIVGGNSRRSKVASALGAYGLDGCRAWEKFVPLPYMYAHPEQRLELLRGLFDSDGHVLKDGSAVEYTSTSPRLFEQVVELARGLGALVVEDQARQTTYSYLQEKRTGRPSHRCRVYFNGVIPVRSEKNLTRWRDSSTVSRKTIVRIEATGEAKPCVCIAVSSKDRLYVTNGYTLTHNTSYVLGLIRSFLEHDHFALLVDAERTTPQDWVDTMLGPVARHPCFFAKRPATYEETVELVRDFCNGIADAKEAGEVPADTSGIIVIDSLRKLVPANIFKKLSSGKEDSIDGVGGRAAQMKAALNAAWLDELIPLLERTGTCVVAIARESEDPDADAHARKFGYAFKITGGKAIVYDASLVLRVELAGKVTEGTDERKRVLGERHRITVRKTKVAGKDDKVTTAFFHTSNGHLKGVPEGFDRPRDVLAMAKQFGIVEIKGAWVKFENDKHNGENAFVKAMHADPELAKRVEAAVREQFKTHEPEGHDDDGVIV
jgi:RecA/RadA recombinase